MDYSFTLANKQEATSLFPAYYAYYRKMYGTSILTTLANKAVEKGIYDAKMGAGLDSAYQKTRIMATKAIEEGRVIKVLDASGMTKGYFRIGFMDFDGKSIAHIGEIVLPCEANIDGRIDEIKGIAGCIEREITQSSPHIETLSYEVIPNDEGMKTALEELGYALKPDVEKGHYLTSIYEKCLLEKETTLS